MTQNEQILAALREGPITPLEALHNHGCFRLAARIAELRARGHAITVERIELPGGKHVARYSLAETEVA